MRKLLLPLVLLFTSLTCFGVTPEEAEEYRQAAEQGNAWDQAILGVLYDNGDGVPEDDTEAVKWYRKAADQGDADAQFNLGLMYRKGDGITQDDVMAYMWFNLAAAQGYEYAKKNKGLISKRMTKEQIAEAQKLSREWMAKRQK